MLTFQRLFIYPCTWFGYFQAVGDGGHYDFLPSENLRREVLAKLCAPTHVPSPGGRYKSEQEWLVCLSKAVVQLNNRDASSFFHTHLCPLPIKVMLGHFTGGRDAEDVDECFVGKTSEYWHLTK